MLSSRGALTTPTLLVECAAAQSKSSKKIFLLSEAEKVWNALGRVIRMQLIQNIPTQIPRLGAFWFDTKLLVTDGPLKYYQRVPKFGFHHTFTSTYALDDIQTPCENLKLQYERLPIDQITSITGVAAQTVTLILNEVFLYLGESLFNGKVLNVDFPGAMNIVMKREKALITFDETLLDDLYAIDSRKWPLAVREMAVIAKAATVSHSARPSSASSSRPRSASSSRPTTHPKSLEPRAAFVSSAQQGRLFAEIKNTPRLISKKPSVAPREAQQRKGPLKVQPHLSPSAMHAVDEEESVYEVLSPERHNIYARDHGDVFVVDERSPRREDQGYLQAQEEHYYAEELPQEEEPLVVERVASVPPSRSAGHRASSVRALLYGDDLPSEDNQRVGRKRFNDRQPDHLGFMFASR